ncbi:PGAP1-like protein-domain-containing protein [Gaertneriomyces semiglobifer]|nr:PGAP1-like protein-domain-containing protein [Gaertneriomyces semiglobifer]
MGDHGRAIKEHDVPLLPVTASISPVVAFSAETPSPESALQKTAMRSKVPTILFSILALAFALYAGEAYFHYGQDVAACKMTYMWPGFVEMKDFHVMNSRFKDYKLYLYKERDRKDKTDTPRGIPVLFIPGNAGSYKQVRSLGSVASKHYWNTLKATPNNTNVKPLDVFALETNDELSAFHLSTILSQASYANHAIQHILSLYPNPPKSVLVIAHSMGGIVARTLHEMDDYLPGSVTTIVTLAAPHQQPPAPFERGLSTHYRTINRLWQRILVDEDPKLAREYPDVARTVIVSLAGGNHDTLVSSDLCEISSFVPSSHGFTTYASAMPDVWTAADHKAVLWCNQIVWSVIKGVSDVLWNLNTNDAPAEPHARVEAFRRVLIHGRENSEPPAYSPEEAIALQLPRMLTLSGGRESRTFRLPADKMVSIVSTSSRNIVRVCGASSECTVIPGFKVPSGHHVTLTSSFSKEVSLQLDDSVVEGFALVKPVRRVHPTPSLIALLKGTTQNLYLGDQNLEIDLPWAAQSILKYGMKVSLSSQNSSTHLPPLIQLAHPPFSEERFVKEKEWTPLTFYGYPEFNPVQDKPTVKIRILAEGYAEAILELAVDWRATAGRFLARYVIATVPVCTVASLGNHYRNLRLIGVAGIILQIIGRGSLLGMLTLYGVCCGMHNCVRWILHMATTLANILWNFADSL